MGVRTLSPCARAKKLFEQVKAECMFHKEFSMCGVSMVKLRFGLNRPELISENGC